MSEVRPGGSKRARGKYARLICLGCRERRIKCELPDEAEVPDLGELRTVQTPCYRCKRLKIPCIVRQTILGRPSAEGRPAIAAPAGSRNAGTGDFVSRIIIELPSRPTADFASTTVQDVASAVRNSVVPRSYLCAANDRPTTLLIHTPQSTETLIIIRAIDTLRREKVENEWFRHLPARVGHSKALDMCVKALVTACAYAHGESRLSSGDCYQALALALNAVQTNIKHSKGELNDDILASTALLAPFEGVLKVRGGVPTPSHIEGLAAILTARSATCPITQLAREIVDFNICDSAVIACIHGRPSPFERIARAYYVNDATDCEDGNRTRLRAIGSELFIQLPRLVGLVRSLRRQTPLHGQLLLDALSLSDSLHKQQDTQAEERLLARVEVHLCSDLKASSPLPLSVQFASVDDFEALTYYWQNRLSLLRLARRIHILSISRIVQAETAYKPGRAFCQTGLEPETNEMIRLMSNILMCAEYARKLPLNRQNRLFAYALVGVWGATRDVPGVVDYIRGDEKTDFVPDLVLRGVNIALPAEPGLTAEDMDIAADIFVGGEPKGKFAELYGL